MADASSTVDAFPIGPEYKRPYRKTEMDLCEIKIGLNAPFVDTPGQIIQQWILGLEYDDDNFAKTLRSEWESFLIPG